MWLRSCLWGVVAILGATQTLVAVGAEPGELNAKRGSLSDAVRSAESDVGAVAVAQNLLRAEAEGNLELHSLLSAILLADEEVDSLARSLAGQIQDQHGNWASIEEMVEREQSSAVFLRYETLRASQPNTLAGHLAMATWCVKQRLRAQARAHMWAVLQFDANHAQARSALGHVNVDGQWITPAMVAERTVRLKAWEVSLEKHGRELVNLAERLLSGNARQVELASDQLMKVPTSTALPAVESVFTGLPSSAMTAACEWLGQCEHPDAAVALARWAVLTTDPDVRTAAVSNLRKKSLHEYVPFLLESSASRVVARSVPTFRRDGTLAGVRHTLATEGRQSVSSRVHDVMRADRMTVVPEALVRPTLGPTRNDFTDEQRAEFARLAEVDNLVAEMRTRAKAQEQAERLQQAATIANQNLASLNRSIGYVLSETAGTDTNASIVQLWDWWNEYSERTPPPIKLVSTRYTRSLALVGRQYLMELAPAPEPELRRACECFVAGTSVRTRRGDRKIEKLTIGDEVLAKDLISGRLVWDPVIAVTNQPPKEVIAVSTDRGTVRCTGGHLFWVSGKGWTKARELLPGDVLNSIGRPAVVQTTESQAGEATFNLVTETFHNYFVGEGSILTHDFQEPVTPPVKVPGLPLAINP